MRREISFKQLYNQVSQLAQALKADGVKAQPFGVGPAADGDQHAIGFERFGGTAC